MIAMDVANTSRTRESVCGTLWIIVSVSVLFVNIVHCRHEQEGEGGCVYSFQVWRPGQDIRHELRSLRHHCTNISQVSVNLMYQIKAELLTDFMQLQNMSLYLHKYSVEQKAQISEIEHKLEDLSRREHMDMRSVVLSDKVKTTVERDATGSARNNMHSPHVNGGMPGGIDYHVSGLEEKTSILINKMKNTLGDLKAEWLLMKRQLVDLQSESVKLKFGQNGIKSETVSLRDDLRSIKSHNNELKVTQDGIIAESTRLKALWEESKLENIRSRDLQSDVKLNMAMLRGEMLELQSTILQVQKEMSILHIEYTYLRSAFLKVLKNLNISEQVAISLRETLTPRLPLSVSPTWRPRVSHTANVLSTKIEDNPTQHETDPNIQQPSPAPRIFDQQKVDKARDCQDLSDLGFHTSAVYEVQPTPALFRDRVYCNMINGSGWTVIQRRGDGLINFKRGWLEYKHGFGNLYDEFWLGNERIHWLTKGRNSVLRVDMWDWEGHRFFAEYGSFHVDGEGDKYRLRVRDYHGDAGDSLSYHNDMAFSTEDVDNDLHTRPCAVDYKSGWWYHSCRTSSLNGVYHMGWYTKERAKYPDGITWFTLKESDFYSLKAVEMKIRAIN